MLIHIAKPQPEHNQILDAMQAACGTTYKAVYSDRHGGVFLLQTDKFPQEIAGHFDGAQTKASPLRTTTSATRTTRDEACKKMTSKR